MGALVIEGLLGQLEHCTDIHMMLKCQDRPAGVWWTWQGMREKSVVLSGGMALRSRSALTKVAHAHLQYADCDGRGGTCSQVHLPAL